MSGVLVTEQIKWVHQQGTIEGFLRRRTPHSDGSSNAISRTLISVFGPLPKTVTYEDTAFSFRTVLVGGFFTFIDAPLVKYRRHGQNITFALHRARPDSAAAFDDFQAKRRIELDRFVEVYKCFATDAERALQQGLISSEKYPILKMQIFKECRRFELKREMLIRSWFSRVCIFLQLYYNTIRPRELLEHAPHLLPRGMYRAWVVTLNKTLSRRV